MHARRCYTDLERDPNRFSPEDCRAACCYKPGCRAWLYNYSIIPHCYHSTEACAAAPRKDEHGTKTQAARSPNVSIGGSRAAGQAIPHDSSSVPQSCDDFDDTGWGLVNAPHDSVLGLAPVNGSVYSEYVRNTYHGYAHLPTLYPAA